MKTSKSPWGKIQHSNEMAPGIYEIYTAGHGGIFVEKHLRNKIPNGFRTTKYSKGGFFEEDCDCVIPMFFFPEICKNEEKHQLVAQNLKSMIERGYLPNNKKVLGQITTVLKKGF